MQIEDYKKYFEPLKENGFVKIDNFLGDYDRETIKDIVKFYSSPKGATETHFSTNIKSQMIKILKCDFKKFFQSKYLMKFFIILSLLVMYKIMFSYNNKTRASYQFNTTTLFV